MRIATARGEPGKRWIASEHPDFAPALTLVQFAIGAPARVRLHARATLSGRVVFDDGAPVRTRPWILAYRHRQPPPRWYVRSALAEAQNRSDPFATVRAFTLVRADEDGSFRCAALDPTSTYDLVCGGGGVASFDTSLEVAPSRSDVVVTVGAVFGASVRFDRERSDGPQPDVATWALPGVQWTFAQGMRALGETTLQAVLLESSGFSPDSGQQVVLAFGDRHASESEALQIEGHMLGCEPFRRELRLPRHVLPLPTIEVDVRSSTSRVCSVTLAFEKRPEAHADVDPRRPIGYVELRDTERSATWTRVSFAGAFHGPRRSISVPHGTYEIAFVHFDAGARVAPVGGGELSFRDDEAEVVFDFDAIRFVPIEIDVDRVPFLGEALVEIERLDVSAKRYVRVLPFAPHEIALLRGARYRVKLLLPLRADAEVEAGDALERVRFEQR